MEKCVWWYEEKKKEKEEKKKKRRCYFGKSQATTSKDKWKLPGNLVFIAESKLQIS